MQRSRRHSWLLAGALMFVIATNVFAQKEGPSSKLLDPAYEGNPSLGKVSKSLLELRHVTSLNQALESLGREGIRLRGASLEVEIRLEGTFASGVAELSAAGLELTQSHEKYGIVIGFAHPDLLDELARVPGVLIIRPHYLPITLAGSVTTQGDAASFANQARSTFGIDGSGVRVGIMSNTFHKTIGGVENGSGCSRVLQNSQLQFTGNLPSSVVILDDGPPDCGGGVCDEGAAMGEIIHDVAPGAGLLFRTTARGEADAANGVSQLRACGADVIVDDVLFVRAPMFQDGIMAQAAAAAVSSGAVFVSAAGNSGHHGFDSFYRDWNPGLDDFAVAPTGNDLHDFGGFNVAPILLAPGCRARFVLQWNEPFMPPLAGC